MSELKPKPELGPEDIENVISQTIENWDKELPEEIIDWIFDDSGNPTKREEVLKHYEDSIKEILDDTKSENHWDDAMVNYGDTNNFHMVFSPEGQRRILEGLVGFESIYSIKPFFINFKYKNLWSLMCKTMSDDVRRVIRFKIERGNSNRKATTEENESLRKIAKFLNDHGVAMTFLSQ